MMNVECEMKNYGGGGAAEPGWEGVKVRRYEGGKGEPPMGDDGRGCFAAP